MWNTEHPPKLCANPIPSLCYLGELLGRLDPAPLQSWSWLEGEGEKNRVPPRGDGSLLHLSHQLHTDPMTFTGSSCPHPASVSPLMSRGSLIKVAWHHHERRLLEPFLHGKPQSPETNNPTVLDVLLRNLRITEVGTLCPRSHTE